MSWIGTAILGAVVLAPAYLIGRRLFERVRVARWRHIREPRCYGDDGGHPMPADPRHARFGAGDTAAGWPRARN